MQKPIKLSPSIVKRVVKAEYDQGRHGKCLICGKGFDDCPHSQSQILGVIHSVRIAEAIGVEIK